MTAPVCSALFCLAGIGMAFHPTLSSGFERMQVNVGDTRHLNYVLEHGYRWLTGEPRNSRLWSPPVFYPAENTAAYSETLLGVAPFYWAWRATGFEPDTSFQLWMLTMAVLNFAAAYGLFRRGFDLKPLSASIGAFLFSFGSSRVSQLGHQHLLPHFYTVMAVYALLEVFRSHSEGRSRGRSTLWVALFFATVTAQVYAGVYFAWFLGLSLSVAVAWAVLLPSLRRPLVKVLIANRFALIISALLSAAAVAPLAIHYRLAASEVGLRGFGEAIAMLPTMQSWLYTGPDSWLYGWARKTALFSGLSMEYEHRIGVGLITTALLLTGLYLARHRAAVRLALLVSLPLILAITMFPGGVTAWEYLFPYIPGAGAIRGVSRIGLVLLLPASLGLAMFFDRSRLPKWALFLLLVLCVVEQGQRVESYDKALVRSDVAELARQIDSASEAFLFTPIRGPMPFFKHQLDAMWASLESGVPTVNGYSSNAPRDWDLWEVNIRNEADDRRIASALSAWTEERGVDPTRISRLRTTSERCYGGLCSHFSTQRVPSTLSPGQQADVTVTMTNGGTSTWRRDEGFGLRSMNPPGNVTWGIDLVELPEPAPPGSTVVFAFRITAPRAVGVYDFQWTMNEDRAGPFGGCSPNVSVVVGLPDDGSELVSQFVPSAMIAGRSYQVSVTLRNTSVKTWTAEDGYSLINTDNRAVWGITKVDLHAPAPPAHGITFNFQVTAPRVPGSYRFEWQMARNGRLFGEPSGGAVIHVTDVD
jgi:hypothetical protein